METTEVWTYKELITETMLDLRKKYYAAEKQKKGQSYYEILIMKISRIYC